MLNNWLKHTKDFGPDPYPGQPRILFIGLAESSHTHSWISLLDKGYFNVRMFALPTVPPPDNWKVRTYVTSNKKSDFDSEIRLVVPKRYPSWWPGRWRKSIVDHVGDVIIPWLDHVLRTWQPHIVHTLGMDWASYLYRRVRHRYQSARKPCWVVQLRGATDLVLHGMLPEHATRIREVIQDCDQVIADNVVNYAKCREMGLGEDKLSSLGVVPGAGGLDIDALPEARYQLPSGRRRIILWPKAYESPYSKALPVLEALRLAWPRIRPCTIKCLASGQPEIFMWVQTLPEELRNAIQLDGRIPHSEVLKLMAESRIMLAPSLSDGIPNTLYEAMACGAFPIVSPLETITPLIEQEKNTLFARNLYPNEIADAIVRAMNEDHLVDTAARTNLDLVSRVANRSQIASKVITYYTKLAHSREAQWQAKSKPESNLQQSRILLSAASPKH